MSRREGRKELDGNERDRLWFYLQNTAKLIESGENRYVLLKDKQGKMTDFCFTQISQYGSLMTTREYSSPCELLDAFYYERDLQAQNHQRADDLFKTVVALSERIRRRVSSQRQELLESLSLFYRVFILHETFEEASQSI